MPDAPRKPRLTKRRIFGIVTTVIALWLAWQVYDIITGKPDPKVDYATPFYELMAQGQPAGENGWTLYTETIDHIGTVCDDGFFAAMKKHEEQQQAERQAPDGESEPDPNPFDELYFPSFDDITHMPFDLDAWEPHLQILALLEADGSFDAITRLCAMRRFVPPVDTSLSLEEINKLGPELGHFRTVAKLNAARMRLAAHDGRWDEYARVADESLILAHIMANQSTILRHLIGTSVAALAVNEVRASAIEFQMPEATCLQVRSILESRLPLPPITGALEGDRLYSLDSLQRTYTASGRLPISAWGEHRGGAFWDSEEVDPIKGGIADALAITIPGHETAARWTNEVFDEAIEFAGRPLADRLHLRFAPTHSAEELPLNQVILRENGLAYLDRLIANDASMECETQGTILMLLIEAHRARHGSPPAELSDLVGEFLDYLPIDPASGQGYGYRRQTDDPHGRSYLLYSLGVDGADDGGEDGFASDWYNPDKTGVDHVINRPRIVDPK